MTPSPGANPSLWPVWDQNDHNQARDEDLQLDEKLVQGLLHVVLVLGRSLASNGVELVDEDDGGSGFPRGLEELADAARSDSDIPVSLVSLHSVDQDKGLVHLVELGSRRGEERYAGLACDSTSQERLSSSGRASEQDTTRDWREQQLG